MHAGGHGRANAAAGGGVAPVVVVVGVLVAGVVVVGVVVVCGPCVATVSVTVAPLCAWWPPGGLWRSTTPTCEASLVGCEWIFGVRPAAPSAAAAVASPWPTTLGTVTSVVARAIVRLTLLPLASDAPACGDCAITLPAVCVEVRDSIAPTSRPA